MDVENGPPIEDDMKICAVETSGDPRGPTPRTQVDALSDTEWVRGASGREYVGWSPVLNSLGGARTGIRALRSILGMLVGARRVWPKGLITAPVTSGGGDRRNRSSDSDRV
jgi:hypothetical protein